MAQNSIQLFKSFSGELDPAELQRKFLMALLKLQNVERGSIWIKQANEYVCIEAAGAQSETVKGVRIHCTQPSIVGWVIENGRMTVSDPKTDQRHYRELEEKLAVKSSLIICFPLFLSNKEVYGALQIIDTTPGKTRINLDRSHLSHIQDLVNIGAISLSNAIVYTRQVRETESLKQELDRIRREIRLVGHGPAFQASMELIQSYARTDYPVLIRGESGTGKELAAQEIHRVSNRKDRPMLVQNCSAIPETLLESELFGYKKGAFSGAVTDKIGLFEAADGGTVFLDEIGDMPLNLQSRILRVIQNSEIKPLGDRRAKTVNIRIISATNQDLEQLIEKGLFRQDLFYRLSVLPLRIPALRDRKEDIPLLLNHFLKKEALRLDIPPKGVPPETLARLVDYPWPGNVRELENLIRYLMVVTSGDRIGAAELPSHFSGGTTAETPSRDAAEPPHPAPDGGLFVPTQHQWGHLSWQEMERLYVKTLLQERGWNISRAAAAAGLSRSTFVSRLKRLGIERPSSGSER